MGKTRLPTEGDWKIIKKLGIFIALFCVVLVSIHDKNITWNNDDKLILWSGTYLEAISYSEIDSIVLEDKMPNLTLKTNGYAAFGKKKGNFIRSSDAEKILLFINKPSSKCIHLFRKDGEEVYFNFDKDEKTLDVLKQLKIRTQG